jgi:hypothetical protein
MNSTAIGPQKRSGQSGEQNSLLLSEIKPAPLDRQACSPVSISSTLMQLNCFAFIKSKEKRYEDINMRLEVYKGKVGRKSCSKHHLNYVLKCDVVER